MGHPLDNPLWATLSTRHAGVALESGSFRRFPGAVAPFAAVEVRQPDEGLLRLVEPGEKICMLQVPAEWSDGWEVLKEDRIVQMTFDGEARMPEAETVPLSGEDIPAMLELTSLVYPHYFRPGTARLGQYFGVWEQGRLAGMAGTRMSMPGWQEISAVCTRPDCRGRGLARSLVWRLIGHIQAAGDRVFLHTELDNEAGQGLYSGMGFTRRRLIDLWVAERR